MVLCNFLVLYLALMVCFEEVLWSCCRCRPLHFARVPFHSNLLIQHHKLTQTAIQTQKPTHQSPTTTHVSYTSHEASRLHIAPGLQGQKVLVVMTTDVKDKRGGRSEVGEGTHRCHSELLTGKNHKRYLTGGFCDSDGVPSTAPQPLVASGRVSLGGLR